MNRESRLESTWIHARELSYDGPLSNSAHNFNLRRYNLAATALGALGNMFGGANVAVPWGDALKGSQFATMDVVAGRKLFAYLQFCLEQIVKDNELGRAVQVDPMKTMLKAPGSMLLKLRYYELLSNFAFKSSLRRYSWVR